MGCFRKIKWGGGYRDQTFISARREIWAESKIKGWRIQIWKENRDWNMIKGSKAPELGYFAQLWIFLIDIKFLDILFIALIHSSLLVVTLNIEWRETLLSYFKMISENQIVTQKSTYQIHICGKHFKGRQSSQLVSR